MSSRHPLSQATPCILLVALFLAAPCAAKLSSPPHQEERAKDIVEQINLETRLGDGAEFWGEQYAEDIAQYTRLFKSNYYTVFADLKIEAPMARCAVNAKYQADVETWLRNMDRYDRAAEELDRKDKARYYFAKGLAKIQLVSAKLTQVPADFYKAAENGFSSQLWAEYVVKAGSSSTGFGSEQIGDVLGRFGESYARGEVYDEAFKMHLLALVVGSDEANHFVKMAEAAERGGSQKLAYKSGVLFLAVFDIHDGLREAWRAPVDSLRITARMSAYDVWHYCESGAIDRAVRLAPPRPRVRSEIKDRHLGRFDSRYASPITRASGIYDDLFEIAICEQYWEDSVVVATYVPRIGSGIDAYDGAVGSFVGRVVSDPRFASSSTIALWEARRWKESKRLDEFARQYPARYKLSGMGN